MRWGGLSGLLGGIIFILSMIVAVVFVPAEPPTFTELVARFPDVLMLRVAENVLYLLGLVLGIPLILAAFGLCGKPISRQLSLGVVESGGSHRMIVSATPHVAHSPLSEIYHTPGTALESQETLGLIWQATWGVMDAPLYVGFFVGMLGFTLLGVATFGVTGFWQRLAVATLVVIGVRVLQQPYYK